MSVKGSAFHDDEDALHLVRVFEACENRFKRDHLADLLRHVSANLLRGEPLPAAAAGWLAKSLIQIADLGMEPNAAFGLAPRRGRKSEPGKAFKRAGLMHALISWGASQFKAAELISEYLSLSEKSELVKLYARMRRQWVIVGPLGNGAPASLAEYLAGATVAVHFKATSRSFPSGSTFIGAGFRECVANSSLFEHIV